MNDPSQKTLKHLKSVAARRGYTLNANARALERLTRSLADNKFRFGRYYCPCKRHYPLDPEADPTCPCPEAADEIAKQGHCECHLFFDPAEIQAKRRPGLLATITCPG
jgi:ferredoxin-thioredoxin reductase catalytic subunit